MPSPQSAFGASASASPSRRIVRRPVARVAAIAMAAAALVAVLLATAAPAEAAKRFRDGDTVEVTGLVTDSEGRPLEGVRVVLEASRTQLDLRRFRRVKKDTTRLTALTDAKGTYELTWPWNGYYNVYELVVGMPVRKPSGETLHELERLDLSRRLKPDAPTVATVVIEDAGFVRNLRRFIASIDSDDERRVYRDRGKPDRVERVEGREVDEESWWYFESGKVYRFRDGSLTASEDFDPVEGF